MLKTKMFVEGSPHHAALKLEKFLNDERIAAEDIVSVSLAAESNLTGKAHILLVWNDKT